MREIVSIHLGNAGNRIGEDFWKLISYEHGINSITGALNTNNFLQVQRIPVFFNKTQGCRYSARAVCIDTEPDPVHLHSFLYNPSNIVGGRQGTGNNFARGFLTEGVDLLEKSLEAIRREVETVDSLQGFQITHSIGGGTGSGYGSLLMRTLSEVYPDNLVANYVIVPSQDYTNHVVEPYNTILSIPYIVDHSHLTFCLDNDALFHICSHNLKITADTYRHVNHLVGLAISGITACIRFPGQLNSGLRKIFVNMIPFPGLHFLVTGFAPLLNCNNMKYQCGTVLELVRGLFSSNNLLCALDLTHGKLLTAAGLFRGRMSPCLVDQFVTNVRNQNTNYFVDWIPNNIKTSICDVAPRGLKTSATFLGNTSAVNDLFLRIRDQADAMLCKRAHLHWYLGEGMEEAEFYEAIEATEVLIEGYDDLAEYTPNSTSDVDDSR